MLVPRYSFILGLALLLPATLSSSAGRRETAPAERSMQERENEYMTGLSGPVCVYNIWSTYDELSDNVALTEDLAMKQLDEILRLRKAGVRFDYFMMDAFWFDGIGNYKGWRKPHWPNGPDRWLRRCKENGIKPGLWVAANSAAPESPRAGMGRLAGCRGRCVLYVHGQFPAGFHGRPPILV